MRIAIITDQHFGARKNSKLFHDYFLKFYRDVFFPTIEEEGITTIVDMGDTFDSRKGIDFSALSWAKDNYYDRLQKMGVTVHTIVGNHTAYYKNTNNINAVDLLLREYKNVIIYSEATEIKIDNLGIVLVPWINKENEEKTLKLIDKTKYDCAMGHLELSGFRAHKNVVMENGMDKEIFSKFSTVFSGHYHTRSSNGSISYLGNPYEMFWNDVNDSRGFHIFDTDTRELEPVNNPYRMFYNLYYNDESHQMVDTTQYENKIVKVIVKNKPRVKEFEKVIDKLYATGVAELKIVENYDFGGWYGDEEFSAMESEDTLSILDRYIQEAEIKLDKSKVQNIMRDIYQEACEMV